MSEKEIQRALGATKKKRRLAQAARQRPGDGVGETTDRLALPAMGTFLVCGCVRHTNASSESLEAWELLDRATRRLDGQTHVLCREYTVEADDTAAAFTEAFSRTVSDAVDAGLFGPAEPPEIRVTQP